MADNAMDFRIQLDRAFQEKVQGKILEATKAISIGLLGVIPRTPVDTGHARWNWLASVDAPLSGEIDGTDKTGEAAIDRARAVIDSLQLGQRFFLSNNAPYIQRLEEGWSKQAPAGMVAVTVASIQMRLGAL